MNKIGIMVVEDENIVAKDIQQSLKKLGYDVSAVCATGEDAIVQAERKKPSLVLMDIMLRGEMSGIEAADHIKQKLNIPTGKKPSNIWRVINGKWPKRCCRD